MDPLQGDCLTRWASWLFAILGLVPSGEFLKVLAVANEARRVGAIVFIAPVASFFEFRNQRFVALSALFFGHAVLGAPPRAVLVSTFVMVMVRVFVVMFSMTGFCTGMIATG